MGSKTVEVKMYDPTWEQVFEQEAGLLKARFGDLVIEVYHVGSTAIPGILSSPVIDMVVEVKNLEKVDLYNQAMRKQGYIPKGESGIAGRRLFIKGTEESPTHYIHVFEKGDVEIAKYLDFRDYLKTHPAEARAYSNLKAELAEKYPDDPVLYTSQKDMFISELMTKIDIWKSNIMKDLF